MKTDGYGDEIDEDDEDDMLTCDECGYESSDIYDFHIEGTCRCPACGARECLTGHA